MSSPRTGRRSRPFSFAKGFDAAEASATSSTRLPRARPFSFGRAASVRAISSTSRLKRDSSRFRRPISRRPRAISPASRATTAARSARRLEKERAERAAVVARLHRLLRLVLRELVAARARFAFELPQLRGRAAQPADQLRAPALDVLVILDVARGRGGIAALEGQAQAIGSALAVLQPQQLTRERLLLRDAGADRGLAPGDRVELRFERAPALRENEER